MKIGAVAAMSGIGVEAIRFYEAEGLLRPASRTDSNYRIYDSSHVERLGFIRRCRSLGMALDEIRALLRIKDAPGENCGSVDRLLDEHIEHVTDRIRELKSLQRQLRTLRGRCEEAQASGDCGILRNLSSPAAGEAPGRTRRHVRGAHA